MKVSQSSFIRVISFRPSSKYSIGGGGLTDVCVKGSTGPGGGNVVIIANSSAVGARNGINPFEFASYFSITKSKITFINPRYAVVTTFMSSIIEGEGLEQIR